MCVCLPGDPRERGERRGAPEAEVFPLRRGHGLQDGTQDAPGQQPPEGDPRQVCTDANFTHTHRLCRTKRLLK